MHILRPDQPPTEEAARFVVELFTDLLTDPAPLSGFGLHGFGFQDLLHHGQVLGQPLPAFLPGPRSGLHGLLLLHGSRCGCLGQSEEEFQLILGDLLAGGAEHPPQDQVELLAKQGVLALGDLQRRRHGLQSGEQFGFSWRRLQQLLREHLTCR